MVEGGWGNFSFYHSYAWVTANVATQKVAAEHITENHRDTFVQMPRKHVMVTFLDRWKIWFSFHGTYKLVHLLYSFIFTYLYCTDGIWLWYWMNINSTGVWRLASGSCMLPSLKTESMYHMTYLMLLCVLMKQQWWSVFHEAHDKFLAFLSKCDTRVWVKYLGWIKTLIY